MRPKLTLIAGFVLLACALAPAQQKLIVGDGPLSQMPDFSIHKPLPVLAPELALQLFFRQTEEQNARITAYQDETIVTAELPDTQQHGEYQLTRTFTAEPRAMTFAKGQFTGDGFVKTNVITRLLQSEVDHVEKADPAETAITPANYKFRFKEAVIINGHGAHVFEVKPRKKRPGLFRGKLYLDQHTGRLHRMEGTLIKSPSFFVKNVEFVQDFGEVDGFTVPTALRSQAKARIIGRAIVSIIHRGYQFAVLPVSNGSATAQAAPTAQSLQ